MFCFLCNRGFLSRSGADVHGYWISKRSLGTISHAPPILGVHNMKHKKGAPAKSAQNATFIAPSASYLSCPVRLPWRPNRPCALTLSRRRRRHLHVRGGGVAWRRRQAQSSILIHPRPRVMSSVRFGPPPPSSRDSSTARSLKAALLSSPSACKAAGGHVTVASLPLRLQHLQQEDTGGNLAHPLLQQQPLEAENHNNHLVSVLLLIRVISKEKEDYLFLKNMAGRIFAVIMGTEP